MDHQIPLRTPSEGINGEQTCMVNNKGRDISDKEPHYFVNVTLVPSPYRLNPPKFFQWNESEIPAVETAGMTGQRRAMPGGMTPEGSAEGIGRPWLSTERTARETTSMESPGVPARRLSGGRRPLSQEPAWR